MSGRYCKCSNHNRDMREHSLGGHIDQCEGCCFALDINDDMRIVDNAVKLTLIELLEEYIVWCKGQTYWDNHAQMNVTPQPTLKGFLEYLKGEGE